MTRLAQRLAVLALFPLAAGATYVCTALAGLPDVSPIVINLTSRQAFGSLGTARNTNLDSGEYIYCTVAANTASTAAGCMAHKTTEGDVSCTTTNPTLIAALQDVPPDAFVLFDWDANKTCTNIEISESSKTEMKKLL